MTNDKGVVNLRLLGIMLIAASILLVTIGSQNAMASFPDLPDVLVEEAAEAGNATMTAGENEPASGTNSTG